MNEEEKISAQIEKLNPLSKLDEAYEERQMQPPAVQCKAYKKYMLFRPYIDPMTIRPYKPADKKLYFKFYNNVDIKLIKYTLEDNGFREMNDRKQEWSIMWASSNIKSVVYQAMSRFQKINHWPKTTEITRKDNMYKHHSMMREKHGVKHFSFVPQSFVLPHEMSDL